MQVTRSGHNRLYLYVYSVCVYVTMVKEEEAVNSSETRVGGGKEEML